jgi:hypothetical protein
MKKPGAVFCVAAALVALINASVWEGAASGSTGTDLPETGYYVATNSFPRNTVVDITNLENGKTVRAVVSAPLENPGLLAVLSRDAASAIGLPNRSIGRVRMNQPADPVAFSRFTEGLPSSGDPDHDPAAFVAANGINPELLAAEETAPAAPVASGADRPETGTGVIIAGTPGAAETTEIAEIAETTETPGAAEAAEIAETTGAAEASPPPDDTIAEGSGPTEPVIPEEETAVVSDKTGAESLEDLTIVDLPEPYVPPVSTKPEEGITPETNPELAWIPLKEKEGEELVEPVPEDRAEVTDSITENAGEPAGAAGGADDIPEPGEALAEESPMPDERTEPFSGDYDLTLVPAEARPPESAEPVMPAGMVSSSGAAAGPVTPSSSSAGEAAPWLPPAAAGAVRDYGFPVPVISELEEGKYYLQLAASRSQDAVKTELAKIGEYWPLAVQVNEGERYPYRILVGPVNQGESRALLLRFKNSGYQHAFVTDRALQTKNR